MLTIHHGDIARANAVHKQIPEFDPSYLRDKLEKKDIKNLYVIICEVDGVDAGYMIAYDTPTSMYLWLNGTLPDYRKRGIFKRMLNDLEKEAKHRQYAKITVKSYERFASMLRALRTLGFKQTDTDGASILFEKTLTNATLNIIQ